VDLDPDYETEAEAWLNEKFSQYLPGLYKLKLLDSTSFPPHMFNQPTVNSISPSRWWMLIGTKEEKRKEKLLPKGFCTFVSSLHCCPASSGSIERIFSSFGLVWSKLRNRLGGGKAEKLVKTYRYLRLKSKSYVDDADD